MRPSTILEMHRQGNPADVSARAIGSVTDAGGDFEGPESKRILIYRVLLM